MNVRSNKELLKVFLDNQELFEYNLIRWSQSLLITGLISREEDELIYKLIVESGIKSTSKNEYQIEPRINWLKENLK